MQAACPAIAKVAAAIASALPRSQQSVPSQTEGVQGTECSNGKASPLVVSETSASALTSTIPPKRSSISTCTIAPALMSANQVQVRRGSLRRGETETTRPANAYSADIPTSSPPFTINMTTGVKLTDTKKSRPY